ncbi:COMPASS component SWD3 [Nakaseomyces bracarensis]|uniref:COMPASS component SWD3 n=1 Tax=Nakaseomyces bracarensis TaxID=273131 RepID=A0ABR4P142_9SACH
MFEVSCRITVPGDPSLPCVSAVFSPDGHWLAVVRGVQVYVYDSTQDYTLAETHIVNHAAPISEVCWSPDGQCLATCSDDFTVVITNRQYGELHRLCGHTAPVVSLCYNSKGNLLFSSSMDESIKIWDVLNGSVMKTMSAHSEPVVSIDVSANDSSILSSGSHDGLIRIFDTATGHCLKTLTYDKDWQSETGVIPITQVKFSANTKYLLVKSYDGIVKIWNCISGEVVRTFKPAGDKYTSMHHACGMDFMYPGETSSTPQSPLVLSGYEHGEVYCWDTNTKETLEVLQTNEDSPIISIHCHDSQVCSLSLTGNCQIWQYK